MLKNVIQSYVQCQQILIRIHNIEIPQDKNVTGNEK